jgi:hypothetical protein
MNFESTNSVRPLDDAVQSELRGNTWTISVPPSAPSASSTIEPGELEPPRLARAATDVSWLRRSKSPFRTPPPPTGHGPARSPFDPHPARSAIAPRGCVIVFDWDDTLYCTTAAEELGAAGLSLPSDRVVREGRELVAPLMRKFSAYGEVVILTNATAHHPILCMLAAGFSEPSTTEIAGSYGCISARDLYCARWADNPLAWKQQAFEDLVSYRDAIGEPIEVLVSIGDSPFERDAVIEALSPARSPRGRQPVLKSVKLLERPRSDQWLEQLRYLDEMADLLFVHYDEPVDQQLAAYGAPPPKAARPRAAAVGADGSGAVAARLGG